MLTNSNQRLVVIALPPPLYLSTIPSFPSRPPRLPPRSRSLIHPTALRYVTLCGVRLTNPTRSLAALLPAAAAAAAAARFLPPPPLCLSTHRPAKPLVAVPPSHPTYRLPHYPAASDPRPSPANPLPADRLLFALRDSALGLFSLPTAVPVAALIPFSLSLSPPPPVLPLPRDARRHPLRATSAPESRALWNTTGSSAIIFCPIVCRACMRARECERGEGNGERMRERTAI